MPNVAAWKLAPFSTPTATPPTTVVRIHTHHSDSSRRLARIFTHTGAPRQEHQISPQRISEQDFRALPEVRGNGYLGKRKHVDDCADVSYKNIETYSATGDSWRNIQEKQSQDRHDPVLDLALPLSIAAPTTAAVVRVTVNHASPSLSRWFLARSQPRSNSPSKLSPSNRISRSPLPGLRTRGPRAKCCS